jgi:hypothetical protein
MKFHVHKDEWYPVYSLDDLCNEDDYCKSAEFSDEEIVHIKRVLKDFDEIQSLLADRMGE